MKPRVEVVEWTPGAWWFVEVSDRDGSYSPLFRLHPNLTPGGRENAQELAEELNAARGRAA